MKGERAGRTALLAFAISFAVLIANGRAIGSGDTNALETTAAALISKGTFVLPDEGAPDPFTRVVPGGRVSIYPALPALLAVPVFFLYSLFFDLDAAGAQIAGKLAAALLAAAATGVLAWSFSKRASSATALAAALLFALGTSVYSTAQALWQHPAVLLFLVIAISALERIEASSTEGSLREAMAAACALSLAAASRPAVIPMCALLFLFLVHRARSHAWSLLLVASIPAAAVALYNATFFGAPWHFGPGLGGRFFAALPESVAGLLISPARGLLVFTPIALLALWGLVRAAAKLSLARVLLAAVITHFLFMSTWNEWHGGESFGPRLLTDLLPALFFFLPEAIASRPKTAGALGLVSIAIQLVGGWTYDYRWERLHQRGRDFDAALWSWRDSPIAFALNEGVVIQGRPEGNGRRLRLPLHRFVPFGPQGSSIEGTPDGLRVSGPALMRDVRLERGARMSESWIVLSHPGDALAFRALSASPREIRLAGFLEGTLRIEIGPKSTRTEVNGTFDVALPVQAEEGEDVFVRAESGELRLARLSLK